MNKLLNDALRVRGYKGPGIKMVLTDVTDINGPYYTDTLASIRNNKDVITGEEGRLFAESIPMERREYKGYGLEYWWIEKK